MCTDHLIPELAGLHEGHLSILQAEAPEVAGITAGLFEALTTYLNPHLPVLTSLIAMVEALKDEDFGILRGHRLIRLPLSVIGIDKVRYRTEVVDWLHESILSFRMSDLAVHEVTQILNRHDICITYLCSCGVVIGRCEDVQAYYASNEHQRMDRLRSAIDAEGNPVVSVDTFGQIMVPTMDLHENGAEERLFARIEELTRLAAEAGYPSYGWLEDELQRFVQQTQFANKQVFVPA